MHISYLRAVYRDECPRSVVWGEPDESVERLRPGRRECLGRALEHTVVDNWFHRVRGDERGQEGEEDESATQHVWRASERGKGKGEPRDPPHIYVLAR